MRQLVTAAVLAASALTTGLLGAGPAPAASAQPAAPQWAQVSAGPGDTCAVQTNRTLWCWGDGTDGQLGDRGDVGQDAPVRVGTGARWVQVAVGAIHACAVRNDHSLWCWGSEYGGELGNGTYYSYDYPVQVPGGDVWASVSGAASTECAIRTDGTLWCWGLNTYGEVGDGTAGPDVLSPVQVGTAADWTSVSAAAGDTCGVRADGSAWCWGASDDGVLGDGADDSSDVPVQVTGGNVWTSVSVSTGSITGATACGIQVNETLWCWGVNDTGQLGNGSADPWDSLVPVQVGTRTGWQHVSVAALHACALHGEPTVWCWGLDGEGELGAGAVKDPSPPVRIGTSPDWLQVSAGDAFDSCGVMRGHTLWCWGWNYDGQLGIGVPADDSYEVPQQVS